MGTKPSERSNVMNTDPKELNLVPYLDIVTNIIMFMLVTTTALAAVGVIDAGAAKECKNCTGSREGLGLTVAVTAQAFSVTAAGRELRAVPMLAPDLCKKTRDGEAPICHDFDALTRLAAEVKSAHPAETRVSITADDGTPYHLIVGTLDALRENRFERDDAGKPMPLFHDVAFAVESR
jgi:biopolymer transport protein ExbD